MLVPIVLLVAPIEKRALLGGTTEWRRGLPAMLVVAALLSVSIKAWSSPQPIVLAAGIAGTLCVWRCSLARQARPSPTRCAGR